MLLVGAGACGGAGERVSIRGDFADTAAVPTAVVAVEGGQQAEVKRGAFVLRDLSGGPVTLRLVRGADTVATLALENVPSGTEVQLNGLETDAPTGRAFPRTMGLNGPGVLVLNGIRMGRDPGSPVDARGAVIAASRDRAALLVRPTDATLPDLRVVVGLGTEVVTADSTRVDIATVARGDSVRVEGSADNGFVVASRVTVMRRTRTAMRDAAPSPGEARSASRGDEPARASPRERAPAVRVPGVPVRVTPAARGRIDPPGHGRGRGHGNGGGHGRGKGKKG